MVFGTQRFSKGMSFVEVLIAVGIFGLMLLAVSNFQRDTFFLNSVIKGSITTAQDARTILRTIVKELRTTSPGANGSYPIVAAASTSLTFFADTNGDGVKKQVRYFVSGTLLKKGVTLPSGSPATYSAANESISTMIPNINSSTTPIFEYFDASYAGTSTPLTLPVDVTRIRLIKVTLTLDLDRNISPLPRTYTSQAMLRNLKDNL